MQQQNVTPIHVTREHVCKGIIRQHALFMKEYKLSQQSVFLDADTAVFISGESDSIDDLVQNSKFFHFALTKEDFDKVNTAVYLNDSQHQGMRILDFKPDLQMTYMYHGLIFVLRCLPEHYQTKELVEVGVSIHLPHGQAGNKQRSVESAVIAKAMDITPLPADVTMVESLLIALGSVERILRSPNINDALKERFSHLAGQIAHVIEINRNLSNQSLILIRLVSQEVDQLKNEVSETLAQ